CSISITFTPTAMGARTGTLTVLDNASGSPQTAALSGTGIVNLTLSTASVNFGNVSLGSASAAQTVTLSNSSSIAVAISGFVLTGSNPGDFSQTNTCS